MAASPDDVRDDHITSMRPSYARWAIGLEAVGYNPGRMGKRTEHGFDPGSTDYVRRRFMIAGDKVILRALERDDLDRCYRWMNDPNIVWTLKSRYPMPFHLEAEWLENALGTH